MAVKKNSAVSAAIVVDAVELNDGVQEIEVVTQNPGLKEAAALESFMNEILTVRVHTTTDDNQPPYCLTNVNGVNMVFRRGQPTKAKRKYVEVLARMREIKYKQAQQNPSDLSDIRMIATEGLCFPFDVLEDPNPKGREWLAHVLASEA